MPKPPERLRCTWVESAAGSCRSWWSDSSRWRLRLQCLALRVRSRARGSCWQGSIWASRRWRARLLRTGSLCGRGRRTERQVWAGTLRWWEDTPSRPRKSRWRCRSMQSRASRCDQSAFVTCGVQRTPSLTGRAATNIVASSATTIETIARHIRISLICIVAVQFPSLCDGSLSRATSNSCLGPKCALEESGASSTRPPTTPSRVLESCDMLRLYSRDSQWDQKCDLFPEQHVFGHVDVEPRFCWNLRTKVNCLPKGAAASGKGTSDD